MIDIAYIVSGLFVGLLIGLTGIGGGALMTPLLILFLGVSPKTAVATDLLFAAVTKLCGASVHYKYRTVDWIVVRRLATGSIPAAAITGWWLQGQPDTLGLAERDSFLLALLTGVLLLTALGLIAKPRLYAWAHAQRLNQAEHFKARQPTLTVLLGVSLGVIVTLTSVGAGALGAAFMMALYPLRLTGARLVATDVMHAIPLALIAFLGYLGSHTVDWHLLSQLLLGSIPGVIVGSLLVHRIADSILRWLLASLLAASAWKLITL